MKTEASDSPLSDDYLMIGEHREPLPIAATPQSRGLALDRRNGVLLVVTCPRWIPDAPQHDDFYELWRLQDFWSRNARCVGLTGPELMVKFDNRDMADCRVEFVTYNPACRLDREFAFAVPSMPLSFDTPYCPPHPGDHWCWMPEIPDRINARRRPVLEASLAKAGIKAKIDEFFRSTDQLGAGNSENAALGEFARFVKKRKAILDHLAQPVPHITFNGEGNFGGGAANSGGDRPHGGRGFPR